MDTHLNTFGDFDLSLPGLEIIQRQHHVPDDYIKKKQDTRFVYCSE